MIRKAVPDDIIRMYSISCNSFSAPWSLASFEAEFLKECSHSYVCMKGDYITGYIIVWDIDGEGEVVNIAVDPACRKRGIASRLLTHAFTAHNDVKIWNLEVDHTNLSAYNLYIKYGFIKMRIIENYYGKDQNAIQMQYSSGGITC